MGVLGGRGSAMVIDCLGCAKNFDVPEHDDAPGHHSEAFWVEDLPRGWIVFDGYPPGDDGLHFACSLACFVAYQGRRR